MGKASAEMAPLQGIRVLDFSHIWAGPYCARILGDLGAEVIKIESVTRYDPERGPAKISKGDRWKVYPDSHPGERPYDRAGRFNAYNRNKSSLTLDLRSDTGKRLIRRIIAISDVVIENFSLGVMARLGIDYDDCKEIRPDILYISLTGFGRTGPEAGYAAFGLTQEAMSGLSSITGYEPGAPMGTGVFYGDPTGGVFGAAAVITGLLHRQLTGEGQLIDLSQREAFITILPELVMDYSANGNNLSTVANKHPEYAPYGCYRCMGEDSWVVINVESDREFVSLCRVMGRLELVEDARFSDMKSRKQSEEELDRLIEAWTRLHESQAVMRMLQEAGVAAGTVSTNAEVLSDPHFASRGFFETVDHPEAGRHKYIGMPWKFSETPVRIRRPAPGLGQHTESILKELIGLGDDEVASLRDQDIIGTQPLQTR